MTARTQKRIARKMQQYLAAKEAGKAGYTKADEILDELVKEVPVNKLVKLDECQGAMVVDQFAEKAIVWKPCGVRRYDLKIQRVAPA